MKTVKLNATYQSAKESAPPGTPVEVDEAEFERLSKGGFVAEVVAEVEKKKIGKGGSEKPINSQ